MGVSLKRHPLFKNKIMENRIPIYNRINLIVDKKELKYILEVVQIDMEKLEENMEHDILEGEEKELKIHHL